MAIVKFGRGLLLSILELQQKVLGPEKVACTKRAASELVVELFFHGFQGNRSTEFCIATNLICFVL